MHVDPHLTHCLFHSKIPTSIHHFLRLLLLTETPQTKANLKGRENEKEMRSIDGGGISWFLLLVLFTYFSLHQMRLSMGHGLAAAEEEMMPLVEEGKAEMVAVVDEKRRKLGSFQICSLCTCCGGGESRSYCLPSPCCYAINCNIPNRPFGFCSFTPKTCNCFGCHI